MGGQGVSLSDKRNRQSPLAESYEPQNRGASPCFSLADKEKHLDSVVRKILPKEIADSVCQKGSRLAHPRVPSQSGLMKN